MATLTPAVGLSDIVTYSGTFTVNDLGGNPKTLRFTAVAALPGAPAPMACTGNLSSGAVVCFFDPGGTFDFTRVRAGSPDITQTASHGPLVMTGLTTTFADLRPGDEVVLRGHDATVAITTLHLVKLRIDTTQPLGAFAAGHDQFTLTGGECTPGAWSGESVSLVASRARRAASCPVAASTTPSTRKTTSVRV